MTAGVELGINSLGARGDGIAELNGQPVFVPYALPGERVHVRLALPRRERGRDKSSGHLRARVAEIIEFSPDRITPACPHFGTCGGCALQHFAPAPSARWKHTLVVEALARRGLPADNVRPLTAIAPGARRRANLTAIRRRNDVVLGFNARESHRVIDVTACPVLKPEITRLLAPLRALLADLLTTAERAEIVINATETGLDLLLVSDTKIEAAGYQAIAAFAETHDLARVSRRYSSSGDPETIIQRRVPMAAFGGTPLALPPGAFLQASAEGEASLLASVIDIAGEAKRIADLYCGCGTFTLPLARLTRASHPRVQGFDGNADAIAALSDAAKAARLTHLSAERRDLDRRPLAANELGNFDVVVFDPPRAGAKAQAKVLAQSRVPKIAGISCNPGTFARDAQILTDGGYQLDWVQPIDQFPWTPHVELAASFSR